MNKSVEFASIYPFTGSNVVNFTNPFTGSNVVNFTTTIWEGACYQLVNVA